MPETPTAHELQQRAHDLIPGGCHTYAKGDDQYPVSAPPFIARGKGCHAWDLDGNEYIEYGMGLRAVTLGHAMDPIVQAVARQLESGCNFTRPSPLEVACAERVLGVVPGAEMIKFTKDGSTVTTAALRLARAHTGRDMVAYCADHPFYSYDDWFIAGFQMSAGISDLDRRRSCTFRYNDLDSVRAAFAAHPGEIACLILEPERMEPPRDDFLTRARDLAHENGALFILDEMITGFRWHLGGAQTLYGVQPDLSAFGKAMANGYALSALVGRREVMELGGSEHDRDRVFLLSTTHGAETHSLAAAMATIDFYEREGVVEVLHRQGERLMKGCNAAAADLGISDRFRVFGRPCNLIYETRGRDGKPSQPFRTIFMQEIIKRGILGPSFVVSYSHTDEDIDRTIEAVREALVIYRRGLNDGPDTVLAGRSVQPFDRRRG